ncbi:MAG: hypothetical protein O7H41_08500 [Planctomycetota bacterium]|nr:hypothetical protein [Planctomycetota bacterium]
MGVGLSVPWSLATAGLALVVILGACNKSSRRSSGGTAPPTPLGITASSADSEVTITWSAVAGATSYNLYWGTSPGNRPTRIGPLTAPSHVHSGLANGTTYYYAVTASNSSLESPPSTEVCGLPIGPPTGLVATAVAGDIRLDWNLVTGASTYNLYWDTAPGVTPATGAQILGVAAPYTHAGLPIGVSNYYVVTAVHTVCGGQESGPSNEATATPGITGVLDPTFGGSGWIVHGGAAGGVNGHDRGHAVTVDSMGRILVTGESDDLGGLPDMVVWRFLTDGTLDTAFNSQGWFAQDGAAGGSSRDSGQDILIDGSDRILITGESIGPAGGLDMVIWRFDATGSLDASFGSGGMAVHNNAAGGNLNDAGAGIALDASGRILVAGRSQNSNPDFDMVVWRYESTGLIDLTFGTAGVAVHDNVAGGAFDYGESISVDSSDRIVVVGWAYQTPTNRDMVIWRFLPTGAFDPTFNGQGWHIRDSAAGGGGHDFGYDLALDGAGRHLVAGDSLGSGTGLDLVIWAFGTSGALDTTFNSQGWVVDVAAAGGATDTGRGIALDSLGRIIVGGSAQSSGTDDEMVVWRYQSTGVLDTTFGTGGVVIHGGAAGTSGTTDWGADIALDAVDRILVTGWSIDTTGSEEMVVWRIR